MKNMSCGSDESLYIDRRLSGTDEISTIEISTQEISCVKDRY